MESIKKYTLTVFNTCTQVYEEVAVTEEVYRAYYRTGWNIKDNSPKNILGISQRKNITYHCKRIECRVPTEQAMATGTD